MEQFELNRWTTSQSETKLIYPTTERHGRRQLTVSYEWKPRRKKINAKIGNAGNDSAERHRLTLSEDRRRWGYQIRPGCSRRLWPCSHGTPALAMPVTNIGLSSYVNINVISTLMHTPLMYCAWRTEMSLMIILTFGCSWPIYRPKNLV